MDVADERALRMREIGHDRVRERETRRGGVGIAGVLGQEVVRAEAEESHVAPRAGVKLLRVSEQERGRGDRVGVRTEVRNIRNPLLFVYDQILDDVQIFGARLE